jgi:flavin-dependent dehydrogenase
VRFDALIIGGGPAGSTTATLLAKAGWSVAVIEKAAFPRRKVCGEFLSATNLPLLQELGVAEHFAERAGPEVRHVGLFAGRIMLVSEMPQPRRRSCAWGRALAREHLDTLLLVQAAKAGASVWQPWAAISLARDKDEYVCKAVSKESRENKEFRARLVIAAHGSWDNGPLPTQCLRQPARPSDLFAFKAHFRDCDLAAGLMPLLVFPGGYGGMVHCDGGRASLSCCIRRAQLEQIRRDKPRSVAAEAVLAHIQNSCLGVRQALARATREGIWLSVGPIRPGIRQKASDALFLVGNAAGEAHPIIAEGISMAMQSAWLLCNALLARRHEVFSSKAVREVGREYVSRWRESFLVRIHVAAFFARLAMNPMASAGILPLLRLFPKSLTLGAYWSGKVNQVVLYGP